MRPNGHSARFLAWLFFLAACTIPVRYAHYSAYNRFENRSLESSFRNDSLRLYIQGNGALRDVDKNAYLRSTTRYIAGDLPPAVPLSYLYIKRTYFSPAWIFAAILAGKEVASGEFFRSRYTPVDQTKIDRYDYGSRKMTLPAGRRILYAGPVEDHGKFKVWKYALVWDEGVLLGYEFAFREKMNNGANRIVDSLPPDINAAYYFDVCRVDDAYPPKEDLLDPETFSERVDSNISAKNYLENINLVRYYQSLKDYSYNLDDTKNLFYSFLDALDSITLVDSSEKRKIGAAPATAKIMFHDTRPLLEAASTSSLLAFNENHFDWRNRYFVSALLDTLRTMGYNKLAMETLSYHDDSLVRRGYPLLGSGYYQREPFMADVMRKALRDGYKLIPYEDTTRYKEGNKARLSRWQWREWHQAHNCYNALKRAGPGKTLILCGYDHINKNDKRGSFVQYLGRLSKRTCITVNQMVFSNFYSNIDECLSDLPAGYYLMDTAIVPVSLRKRADFWLVNNINKQPFQTGHAYGSDKTVYLPKIHLVDSLPGADTSQYQLQVYYAGENSTPGSIPFVNILARKNALQVYYYLPRDGSFVFYVRDGNGKILLKQTF